MEMETTKDQMEAKAHNDLAMREIKRKPLKVSLAPNGRPRVLHPTKGWRYPRVG